MTPRRRDRRVRERVPRAAGSNVCTGRGAPARVRRRPGGKGKGGQLRYEVTSRPAARAPSGSRSPAPSKGPRRRAPSSRLPWTIPTLQLAAKIAEPRALGPLHPAGAARRPASRGRPSTGASRTSPTSAGRPRTSRSAGPTRASSSRRPLATVRARAGWAPGSPTTRGCSPPTASTRRSRASRSASSRPIEDHLRALREISDILNDAPGSCHEVISDGSIWFGQDSRHTDPRRGKYDFNTDETVKFPSAVALLWRWSGDNAFRDAMYDFAKRNLRYAVKRSTRTGTAGPRAWATSSATAWASRSSTTRLPDPRAV